MPLVQSIDNAREERIGPHGVAAGAAFAVSLAESGNKPISVMMAYADRLERFTHWYVQLRAESLGELLMHFMLETIVAAHLLGIDAFDQPAVEEGKVLAKKYLTS